MQEPYEIIESYLAGNERSLRHDHKRSDRRGPSRRTRHSSAGCANAFRCVRARRSDGQSPFLSGMLATSGHTATALGVVGKDLDVKAGREAAYTAALNVLALTKKQLGSLNRVSHVVRLGVYVAATSEFTEHAKVADAASELLQDVFGEETVSSRLVFGAASLPLGSPVELEVILEV